MIRFKSIAIFFIIIVSTNSCSPSSDKMSVAQVQIELLCEYIVALKKDIGRYPSAEEGLNVLYDNKAKIYGWKGPYINAKIPLDPWRHEYKYIFPAKYGGVEFNVYSFGVNGIDDMGDKDDITNWKKPNFTYYY